jgi:glutathione peroxidase
MDVNSFYNIELLSLTGQKIDLGVFKGKKIMVVNTASECGFTYQYNGLQTLYQDNIKDLMIIGVPSNQFGKQELGTADTIESFCQINYGVSFLMTEKMNVKGGQQHALYKWLTNKNLNGYKNSSVKWNFQKYLIDENGQLINYFYSLTKSNSRKITKHFVRN